jgi:molecular chaperone DnaK (HSP70)
MGWVGVPSSLGFLATDVAFAALLVATALEVLATSGDAALGGDDFDHRVFCWLLEVARLAPLSARDTRLLLSKSREAKEALTLHGSAGITARLSTGEVIEQTLTTEIFAEITKTLVAKTLGPVRKALRDAQLGIERGQQGRPGAPKGGAVIEMGSGNGSSGGSG